MWRTKIHVLPLHTLQLCNTAWKSMTPSPLPSTSFSRSRIIPFPKVSSTWHGWQSEEVCVWHQARSSASINGLHGFTFSQIGSLLSADQILPAATKIGGKKWFSQLTTIKFGISHAIPQFLIRPTTVPRSCGAPSSTHLGRSCHHRSLGMVSFLNESVGGTSQIQPMKCVIHDPSFHQCKSMFI